MNLILYHNVTTDQGVRKKIIKQYNNITNTDSNWKNSYLYTTCQLKQSDVYDHSDDSIESCFEKRK